MIIEELVSIDVNPVESDEIVENENYLPIPQHFQKIHQNSSYFISSKSSKIIQTNKINKINNNSIE